MVNPLAPSTRFRHLAPAISVAITTELIVILYDAITSGGASAKRMNIAEKDIAVTPTPRIRYIDGILGSFNNVS